MLIQVRCGKGRRDRYVALAQPTLDRLREHWRRFRPERHLFYTPRNKSQPVTLGTVQRAFKRAVEASSLTKKVTLHTLRHSYATHLLEHGVSLRSIQESLGHERLQTTMRYTHIAEPSLETVRAAVESMTLPV